MDNVLQQRTVYISSKGSKYNHTTQRANGSSGASPPREHVVADEHGDEGLHLQVLCAEVAAQVGPGPLGNVGAHVYPIVAIGAYDRCESAQSIVTIRTSFKYTVYTRYAY